MWIVAGQKLMLDHDAFHRANERELNNRMTSKNGF